MDKLLGFGSGINGFTVRCIFCFPLGKYLMHLFGISYKLGVRKDILLNFILRNQQRYKTITVTLTEQVLFQRWIDIPIRLQCIYISLGNITKQMGFYVLNILGFGTVDVSWYV